MSKVGWGWLGGKFKEKKLRGGGFIHVSYFFFFVVRCVSDIVVIFFSQRKMPEEKNG